MVGFPLDLFLDLLHWRTREGEEGVKAFLYNCGTHLWQCHPFLSVVTGQRRSMRVQSITQDVCYFALEGHLHAASLVASLHGLPSLSHLTELLWFGTTAGLAERASFFLLVLGGLLFAHCCLFPVWSLPPRGLQAGDPGASCRALRCTPPYQRGGSFVSSWDFWSGLDPSCHQVWLMALLTIGLTLVRQADMLCISRAGIWCVSKRWSGHQNSQLKR